MALVCPFSTVWCMWDHGVSVEHLLVCMWLSGDLNFQNSKFSGHFFNRERSFGAFLPETLFSGTFSHDDFFPGNLFSGDHFYADFFFHATFFSWHYLSGKFFSRRLFFRVPFVFLQYWEFFGLLVEPFHQENYQWCMKKKMSVSYEFKDLTLRTQIQGVEFKDMKSRIRMQGDELKDTNGHKFKDLN